MADREPFATPQRILTLVEPFELGIDSVDVPELQWWDNSQEWDEDAYEEASAEIFAEHYEGFIEAAEAVTPGRKDGQRRIWRTESPSGVFSLIVSRDREVHVNPDEFADYLTGPSYGLSISGPANFQPIEGIETAGATQTVDLQASQGRWSSHSEESGKGANVKYTLWLPNSPKLEETHEEQPNEKEDAAPRLIVPTAPAEFKIRNTIRGSDTLLSSFALGVKVLQHLDVKASKILTK